ncbi:MAG: ABC transporter permease, partial [Halobacteriota archaeon]
MSAGGDAVGPEAIAWDDLDRRSPWLTAERIAFALGGTVLLALFLYDRYYAHVYLVFDWRVDALEWLFLLGLVLLTSFGLVPAIKRWGRTRGHLARLLRRPTTAFAMLFLAGLFVVGLLGPILIEPPGLRFGQAYTPPVGFSTTVNPYDCGGEVTGPTFERVCHGTWGTPLGTNH